MRTVLVVEDEALIALDLACSIESLGYRVLGPALSGEEARRIAEKNNPDLLVMDITLQGKADGIETARAITQRYPAKIVFLTALSDAATRARASSLNPMAFLAKPWTTRQMQKVLNEAFSA